MYEITIHKVFSAAHAIRLHDGSLEPLHGHNWSVEVTAAADQLDAIQTVMDFHVLEKHLDALLAKAHNRSLNEVEPFTDGRGGLAVSPTAERVAWWIATVIDQALPAEVRLVSVKVGEAPGCYATYRP